MKKDQNTLELSRVGRLRNVLSDNLPGWQLCPGISGSLRLEWVAGLLWNQWQAWRGIRTVPDISVNGNYAATPVVHALRPVLTLSANSRHSLFRGPE